MTKRKAATPEPLILSSTRYRTPEGHVAAGLGYHLAVIHSPSPKGEVVCIMSAGKIALTKKGALALGHALLEAAK